MLYDDPSTSEEDWQLFHESLREYLHAKWATAVIGWQRQLADWGFSWRSLASLPISNGYGRAAETYAMRWTAIHLDEMTRSAKEAGQAAEQKRREDQLLTLVEDEGWRARSFLLCGNAEALRRALQLAQHVAVARYRGSGASTEALRVARFAHWIWGEEVRLFEQQRQQLKNAHRNQGTHWRDAVNLASMGARPARDSRFPSVIVPEPTAMNVHSPRGAWIRTWTTWCSSA